MGLPSPSPRSVAGLQNNEGIFGVSPSEPVLEVIEKVERRFAAAANALDARDREHRLSVVRWPSLLVYGRKFAFDGNPATTQKWTAHRRCPQSS